MWGFNVNTVIIFIRLLLNLLCHFGMMQQTFGNVTLLIQLGGLVAIKITRGGIRGRTDKESTICDYVLCILIFIYLFLTN